MENHERVRYLILYSIELHSLMIIKILMFVIHRVYEKNIIIGEILSMKLRPSMTLLVMQKFLVGPRQPYPGDRSVRRLSFA